MAVLDGISGLTSAFSVSRKLLDAYSGAFYTLGSGSDINRVLDQSAVTSYWEFVTNHPQLTTAGPMSRAVSQFITNDHLAAYDSIGANIDLGALITASTGYSIISFIVNSYTTDNGTIYNNEAVWADNAAWAGLYLRSTPTIVAYNFDVNIDAATVDGEATGTVMTIEWRHEGGNLYIRKNAGTWSSPVASGNTGDVTGHVIMGGRAGGPPTEFIGYIFEGAFFNAIPSSGDMDTIATNFYEWAAGAVVTPEPIALLSTSMQRKWRAIGY